MTEMKVIPICSVSCCSNKREEEWHRFCSQHWGRVPQKYQNLLRDYHDHSDNEKYLYTHQWILRELDRESPGNSMGWW